MLIEDHRLPKGKEQVVPSEPDNAFQPESTLAPAENGGIKGAVWRLIWATIILAIPQLGKSKTWGRWRSTPQPREAGGYQWQMSHRGISPGILPRDITSCPSSCLSSSCLSTGTDNS